MSARLPDETREQLLAELALHERHTLKAIGRRHGVSRQLLWKLRDEMRRSQKVHMVEMTTAAAIQPRRNAL